MAGGPMAGTGASGDTPEHDGSDPIGAGAPPPGVPTLGVRVRTLRKSHGMTLAVLSGASGLSVSYLNDIEHDRTIPRLERLHAVAQALGTNVRDLFDGVHPYGI